MGRIVFVVGARPNFMKVAPVFHALQARNAGLEVMLVHTGQHYDDVMSDTFVRDLGLPAPELDLGVGAGTHGEQTASALVGVERALLDLRADLAVVAGDVNSTLAGALAAVKINVPVAHIEAGLRSFDPSMPEEHNRRLTDHVSDILLVHSQSAVDNLQREGITSAVHLVGNTMIDTLLANLDDARARRPWDRFDFEEGGYGLVTLHRPALVDEPDMLRATVAALHSLADEIPLVFPAHPRTRDRLERLGVDTERLGHAPPLGYLDFLGLQAGARFVLTDSGGVQEETSALGVPCFTLRDTTERPVTIELGTNTLLGLRPDRIGEIPALLERPLPVEPIPFWDGHAGERAAVLLAAFVEAEVTPVVA